MEFGKEGRRVLRCDELRVESRGCRTPEKERDSFCLCSEGRVGGMEGQKIMIRLDQPALSRFVKLCRVFVRIALGTLFVFAGAAKAYDPGAFAIEIQRYQLVPWVPGAIAALYLPWLEML